MFYLGGFNYMAFIKYIIYNINVFLKNSLEKKALKSCDICMISAWFVNTEVEYKSLSALSASFCAYSSLNFLIARKGHFLQTFMLNGDIT